MDHDTRTQAPALLWLKQHEPEMLGLLERLVNSDSPSRDRAAVDQTGTLLKDFFATHGIATETEPHPVYGEAIHATSPTPAAPTPSPSSCSATATPSSRRARPPAAPSASRTAAPTAPASPT